MKNFLVKDVLPSLILTALIGLFGHFGDPIGPVDVSRWNWFTVPLSSFYHSMSGKVGGEAVLIVIVFVALLALSLGIRGLIHVCRRVKIADDIDKARWLTGWRLAVSSFIINAATGIASLLLALLLGVSDETRAHWFGQAFVDWKHDHHLLWLALMWGIPWLAFAFMGYLMRISIWPNTRRSAKKMVSEAPTMNEVDAL